MVDVRALAPALPSAQRPTQRTVQVKPFRVPNPEALRQWKDAVERFPNGRTTTAAIELHPTR